MYLAAKLHPFCRKFVGWAMANNLRAEPVLDALDMAACQRRPKNVIHPATRAINPCLWD